MEHTALTADDRCDRCGAQAYAKTVHGNGRPLYWCAHHLRDYPALIPFLVVDQTHRLREHEQKEPAKS